MAKKPSISLRKDPKQDRSRTLVSSAIQATTRVLGRFGYEGASTNRIADLAGISIGSLYQYFPNKDALLGAVVDHFLDKHIGQIEEDLKTYSATSLETAIERIVDHMVSMYLDNKKVMAVLFEHVPRVQRVKNILRARHRIAGLIAESLRSRPRSSRLADPEAAAYLVVSAVMGALLAAIIDDEFPLGQDELKRELVAMVRGYIL
jgi:AcrR family transcriptional regulator